MSLGSSYDMVLLPPRGDTEPHPKPIPPQPVRGRRSGHHAGGARRGRQRSRIPDPTTEARARPALPPHIPHQIANSSGPPGARGRARGATGSAPRTNRGTSRPPVPPRSKGKTWLPPPLQKRDLAASTSRHPPPMDGGKIAAPPDLRFGLRSTAATYASSASTSLSAYADLPGHHLRSTLDLITTPPVSSYPEDPTSGEDGWAGTDFSGCGDPETFMRFLEASNYCLGYSDSDDGGYDPSRECFNLEVRGAPPTPKGVRGPPSEGTPLHLPTRLLESIQEHTEPHRPPQRDGTLTSSSSTSWRTGSKKSAYASANCARPWCKTSLPAGTEARLDAMPGTSTAASLRTKGETIPQSSARPARM